MADPRFKAMRRHTRHPFRGKLKVCWTDSRGQVKILSAKCLDLSAEGARLQTDVPVPARTRITVRSALYGTIGTASVRHCVRENLKYLLGVEFTSSLVLAGPGRMRCLEDAQALDHGDAPMP